MPIKLTETAWALLSRKRVRLKISRRLSIYQELGTAAYQVVPLVPVDIARRKLMHRMPDTCPGFFYTPFEHGR